MIETLLQTAAACLVSRTSSSLGQRALLSCVVRRINHQFIGGIGKAPIAQGIEINFTRRCRSRKRLRLCSRALLRVQFADFSGIVVVTRNPPVIGTMRTCCYLQCIIVFGRQSQSSGAPLHDIEALDLRGQRTWSSC